MLIRQMPEKPYSEPGTRFDVGLESIPTIATLTIAHSNFLCKPQMCIHGFFCGLTKIGLLFLAVITMSPHSKTIPHADQVLWPIIYSCKYSIVFCVYTPSLAEASASIKTGGEPSPPVLCVYAISRASCLPPRM